MTPKQILSGMTRFASGNRRILLYVVGGLAAAGIVAGVIMFTSGGTLQGALIQPAFNPIVIPQATMQTDSCTVGEKDTRDCSIKITDTMVLPGTQTRTCLRENYWGEWGSCTATAPATCTSFTYSDWGACTDGSQTRTVLTSSPSGCTGGNPALRRTCLSGESSCTAGTAPETKSCTLETGASGSQTRKCAQDLGGGGWTWTIWSTCKAASATTCMSFTYSDYGVCGSDGKQTRQILTSTPQGCTGGRPILSQSCTPQPTQQQQQQQQQQQTQVPPPEEEEEQEAPTSCTGEDILVCSAMSDQLVLADKIPVRINCSLTGNGYVTSQVIKGALTDPSEPQTEDSIVRRLTDNKDNLLDNKSMTASKTEPKGFYMLFDGFNKTDTPVEEGDYSILTTARRTANSAPDCSVQVFSVIKESPEPEPATETPESDTGSVPTAAPATVTAAPQAQTPAEPETPPEPSKCPGVNYPKDVKGHWAENLIKQAYDVCMFKGYDDGTFKPDRAITRAEALKTILSAAGIKPILGCYDADCGTPYFDLEMWQGQWVRAAWNVQIIKSGSKFRPNDPITRAEAAVMVANAFIKAGKITTPLRTDCYTANCGAGYPDNFFTDITEKWQGSAVRWLWDAGLTSGRAPGRFEPNIPITRAELTKLVMLAAGK